jgi:hypothetical protein
MPPHIEQSQRDDRDVPSLLPELEHLSSENARLRVLAEDNQRARQEAEQQARALAAPNPVSAALSNVTDLQASLTLAARELTRAFNTRGSTVTLIDEARTIAEAVAEFFTDPSPPSVIGLSVPLDTPAWQQLDEERTAVVVVRRRADDLGDAPGHPASRTPPRMRERAMGTFGARTLRASGRWRCGG